MSYISFLYSLFKANQPFRVTKDLISTIILISWASSWVCHSSGCVCVPMDSPKQPSECNFLFLHWVGVRMACSDKNLTFVFHVKLHVDDPIFLRMCLRVCAHFSTPPTPKPPSSVRPLPDCQRCLNEAVFMEVWLNPVHTASRKALLSLLAPSSTYLIERSLCFLLLLLIPPLSFFPIFNPPFPMCPFSLFSCIILSHVLLLTHCIFSQQLLHVWRKKKGKEKNREL